MWVFVLFCEQELQCVKLIPGLRTVSSMFCMNLICSFFGDVRWKIVLLFIKISFVFSNCPSCKLHSNYDISNSLILFFGCVRLPLTNV